MSDHIIAGRIGRRPSPGEGTVQLLLERPDVLEFMAMTEFAGERGLRGIDMESAWRALPDVERTERIDRAFRESAASGAAYDASLPPEPPRPTGGGQSLLIEPRVARIA